MYPNPPYTKADQVVGWLFEGTTAVFTNLNIRVMKNAKSVRALRVQE